MYIRVYIMVCIYDIRSIRGELHETASIIRLPVSRRLTSYICFVHRPSPPFLFDHTGLCIGMIHGTRLAVVVCNRCTFSRSIYLDTPAA